MARVRTRKRVQIGGNVVFHLNKPHTYTHTAATSRRLNQTQGVNDFTRHDPEDSDSSASSSESGEGVSFNPNSFGHNETFQDMDVDDTATLPMDDIVSVPAARKAVGLNVIEKNRSLNSVGMKYLYACSDSIFIGRTSVDLDARVQR